MSRFPRLPGLALLAVLVAGCTSSAGAATTGPSAAVSTPPAAESPSADATVSAKPTKSPATTAKTSPKTSPTPKLPAGFSRVSVASKGFSIGVPKAWVQLNASELSSLTATLDELKKSNPEQATVFEQAVKAIESGQIALMAMDAKSAASGFATNVNVIVQNHVNASARDSVRTAVIPQLQTTLGVSEDAIDVTDTDVAAGPALRIDFTYAMSGTDIRARQFHIFGAKHYFIVTFSTGAAAFETSTDVFDQIIGTLQDQ